MLGVYCFVSSIVLFVMSLIYFPRTPVFKAITIIGFVPNIIFILSNPNVQTNIMLGLRSLKGIDI